jgi:hypothetical protein
MTKAGRLATSVSVHAVWQSKWQSTPEKAKFVKSLAGATNLEPSIKKAKSGPLEALAVQLWSSFVMFLVLLAAKRFGSPVAACPPDQQDCYPPTRLNVHVIWPLYNLPSKGTLKNDHHREALVAAHNKIIQPATLCQALTLGEMDHVSGEVSQLL